MKKRIKTNGILTGIAVVLCILFFKFLIPDWNNPLLNKALALVAFTLFLSGQILRILGRAYKITQSAKGAALVKEGPYAVVRNPMYLGSFLMGLSFTVLLGSPLLIVVFLVIFFTRFLPQVRLEERTLLGRFGKAYQEYLASVPRFIPKKINTLFKKGFNKYLETKTFPWLKKEIWAAVGWLVLFLLIALLKDLMIYDLMEFIKEMVIFICVAFVFIISGS